MRVLFEKLFGEYALLASILFWVAGGSIGYFFWDKKHRNWKLYKKIKGERAEKTPEEERYPEIKNPDIFPDLPPEESEEE